MRKLLLALALLLLPISVCHASSTVTASARQYTAGSTEYHSISDNASISYTGDMTVMALVYLDSTGAQRAIVVKQTSNTNSEWWLYITSGNRFGFGVTHNGNISGYVQAVDSTFGAATTGVWYLVTGRWNATTHSVSISVNDVTPESAIDLGVTPIDTTSSLGIGAQNPGGSVTTLWNGRIATVGFWKRELSEADIDAVYNAGACKLYKDLTTAEKINLVSWWDGAETSGVRVDAHGTNHLTDNNTVTSAAGKVTYTAEDARYFTSANSEYFSIANASAPNLRYGNEDFYICGWVNQTTVAVGYVAGKWAAGDYEWILYYRGSGYGYELIVDSYGNLAAFTRATSTLIPQANTWYFLEAYHDSVNNVVGISVNRNTDTTTSHTTGVNAGTTHPLNVGGTSYFNGKMQGLAFISGIPTASERDALYSRGFGANFSDKPVFSAATIDAWYDFNEASGNALDAGANGYNLTDNNTVTGAAGVVYDAPAVSTRGRVIMISNARLVEEPVYA